MTAEEYLAKMKDPLWYGEQDENGVDLSLIRANLDLSPEERLLKGDRCRAGALELRQYGELHRATKRPRTEQNQKRPANFRRTLRAIWSRVHRDWRAVRSVDGQSARVRTM